MAEPEQPEPNPQSESMEDSSPPADDVAVSASSIEHPSNSLPFLIAGVGASAGGLEAFTQLLHGLPPDTGIAFVFIQHLDPHHDSQLTPLLAPATEMPVQTATDGMPVEPNHIYIIPPNSTIFLEDGKLRVGGRKPGLHLPVDAFFDSLAANQGSKAIGVILSGTGSDGAKGIRSVKAVCGVTFAQNEESARYYGMPSCAIETGAVDFVLPPEGIAQEIARIARHPFIASQIEAPQQEVLPEGEADFRKILRRLWSAENVDFSNYKRTTVRRRIGRRMLVLRLDTLADYSRYVEEHPSELQDLYRDLLISVTSFFRDPQEFETVTRLLAARLAGNERDLAVRVWVPGCATGEEVYSLAICFYELLQEKKFSKPLQLFGTDIDEPALERARAGMYDQNSMLEVSPERLRRFFVRQDAKYQIAKVIRESCIFARQDLTHDPPFSHLDVVSCRNVLIYMDAALQERLLPIFHYSLKPGGLLMLGTAETIGSRSDLFSTADKQHHIYVKKPPATQLHLPIGFKHPPATSIDDSTSGALLSSSDLQKKVDHILQSKYSPSGVVVDSDLKILQFRGNTSRYLDPRPGEASLNLLRMAPQELSIALRKALHAAGEANFSTRESGSFVDASAEQRRVEIEVTPIGGTLPPERYFLIVFQEAGRPESDGAGASAKPAEQGEARESTSDLQEQVRQLNRQLAEAREYLRNLKEDHEAHLEELRAANEEVRSTNEELQSTNEELSTTKEELQSTNEELSTLNQELQNRNDELNALNSDLRNLLAAVNLPIIMVDNSLRIRRFNAAAEKLWAMTPGEVGRPIGHLRGPIVIPQLEELIGHVIESLEVEQREIQDSAGHWYSFALRPYRTLDDHIDGAVITITDIDGMKRSLQTAVEARDYAEALIETVREPLVVLDVDLRVQRATSTFYETFQVNRAETEGRSLYDLGNGEWNRPRLRQLLGNALFRDEPFFDYEMEHHFPHLGQRTFRLNARRISGQEPRRLLLAIEDLTKRREEAEVRYRRLFETAKDGMVVVDDETGEIVDINSYVLDLTRYPREEFIGKKLTECALFRDCDWSERLISELREKEVVRLDKIPLRTRNGRPVLVELIANRYLVGTRSVIHLNLRDITERERAAAQLRENQENFRLFVASVREYAMFQTDPAGIITAWNPGAERVLGYTAEEIVGQPIAQLFTPEDIEKGEPENERQRAREQGSSSDVRWHVRKDGSRFFADGILSAIRDDDGQLRAFAKVMRDATAERQADEQIRRSLKEKETLLKEIHHRVRNNLQVIISLIQLQSDYVRDPAAVQALKEMHNRIRSIAAIHEMLYASANISQIDFSGYLEKLAQDLFAFHHTRLDQVRLKTDIEDVQLDLNQAVPCGLIVSELISNSLEHAFPDKRPGLVQIILRQVGDQCSFSIGDNGGGLPPDLDPMHATSMGLQLVRLLVEQLGGKLQVDRSQGTRFTITFPCHSGEESS